jgi:hypothetical protein
MTQSIKNVSVVGSIAFAALMLLALPTSFANADGFDEGYSYGYSYPESVDSGYSYGYSYPESTDTGYSYGYSYPDYGYSTPSYGYSTPSYSTGGFMTGGYSTAGYMTGGGYNVGYTIPSYTPSASGYTYTYAPTNIDDHTTTIVDDHTQTCVANSCNHDDHSVVNIQNPAPVINNNNIVANYTQPQTPVAQYCPAGYYGNYPNCYRNTPVYTQPAQPVVYTSATPYIDLAQAPYTGLELGFWGTVAYWGFMIAFALFAAYLIAVKRVQNVIVAKLSNFLFGSDDEVVVAQPTPAFAGVSSTKVQSTDAIDDFILSQINRVR